jgi:hypothetical protein
MLKFANLTSLFKSDVIASVGVCVGIVVWVDVGIGVGVRVGVGVGVEVCESVGICPDVTMFSFEDIQPKENNIIIAITIIDKVVELIFYNPHRID